MAYTKDGIMAQVYIAFGQGTGPIRVSQDTCSELHDHFYHRITDQVVDEWDEEAVQVLERIRAIGRLMAANATIKGQTRIQGDDVVTAAQKVETESETALCSVPPKP